MTGLVACGDGGNSSISTAASAPGAGVQGDRLDAETLANSDGAGEKDQQHPDEALVPEEQEAKRTVTGFYSILGSDREAKSPGETTIDSESFCDLMSEKAIAQTIHFAEVSSGIAQKWDCESATELLLVRSDRSGSLETAQRAKVIGVNAEGERATASVRFGGGAVTSISLVKEDREWKLAASLVPLAP